MTATAIAPPAGQSQIEKLNDKLSDALTIFTAVGDRLGAVETRVNQMERSERQHREGDTFTLRDAALNGQCLLDIGQRMIKEVQISLEEMDQ